MSSHDDDWKEVKTHAHALPPHSKKKWTAYELVTDSNTKVIVDFENGRFYINGQRIHPADRNGVILSDREDKQKFEAGPAWSFCNGMKYFPVVGKRVVKGFSLNAELPFCGWKIKQGERTVEKIAFIYPNGEIALQ